MKTAIESILLSRKTALLYRNTGVGQAASIANAVMLAYLMAVVFNIAGAAWWLALALMVALGRVALARAYRRDVQRDGRASLWCRRSALGAAASGAVWGAARRGSCACAGWTKRTPRTKAWWSSTRIRGSGATSRPSRTRPCCGGCG